MTTTTTRPTPTCQRATLAIPCLKCGESGGAITLDLNAMHDEAADAFRCGECEAEWTLAEVRDAVSKWSRLLVWISNAPTAE